MNNAPLVSIGVPTYNRPALLKKALESLLAQTYANIEIIVSDNASPDDETQRIVHALARKDPRIRCFRQEANIGAVNNFKFVLSEARGPLFAWFADDDSCHRTFIEELVSCLLRTDAVLAMSDVRVINEVSNTETDVRLADIRWDDTVSDWKKVRKRFFDYSVCNIFFCIYGLYRTDALRSCELVFRGRWKNLTFGFEFPFLAKIAMKGKILSIPKTLKIYHHHRQAVFLEEMAALRFFDRWIRTIEVRLALFNTAWQSDLPFTEKLPLCLFVWTSMIHWQIKRLWRIK